MAQAGLQQVNGHSASRQSRKAQPSDSLRFLVMDKETSVPDLIHVAQGIHEESRFGHIPFSIAKVESIARKVLGDPKRHALMLAYKHNQPVGFAYCSIGEYHIGTETLLTTIHAMGVLKSTRSKLSGGRIALGLMKGVVSWSKARGASEIMLHVTSGVNLPQTHKLAKRLGFNFIGGSYAKSV